jgi:ABC-type Fe3+/spermidine/putrescine transport system ATPase subunit
MLTIQTLSKSFDQQAILKQVSFSVGAGDILALLGRSGSGKTTLLRCIAGLEQPDSGDIWLEGESVLGQAASQRGIGLMFQDYALFPHLNVAQNVAFGLEMQKQSPAAIEERVQEVLTLVGMESFGKRAIQTLSGGEQQRVSLARSLAPKPRILLLDEPLGSLDAVLRGYLMTEIRQILKAAGVTAIYVTHDQSEAFTVADRVGILRGGVLEQVDTPRHLYERPHTSAVAEFLGLQNILPVTEANPILFDGEELYELQTPLGAFMLGRPAPKLLLHPAFLHLMREDEQTISYFILQVEQVLFKGGSLLLELKELNSRHALRMMLPLNTPNMPQVGDYVQVKYTPQALVPLDS